MSAPTPGTRAGRPAGPGIPADPVRRAALQSAAEAAVRDAGLRPPQPLATLRRVADEVLAATATADRCRDFATLLVGNAVWAETIARVPYERRVFLLPQCLRQPAACRGRADGLGLLCAGCGACPIGELLAEAEGLGYACLVAEGTTIVTTLLEQGEVDAVVGVSCLPLLEQSFPPLVRNAIPGLAIPLLRDGCRETAVDLDAVRAALHARHPGEPPRRIELDRLRREVEGWFAPSRIAALLGEPADETARLAQDWLARGGKRWRPLLTAAAWQALTGREQAPPALRRLALAVECFHKASLLHDDIEDEDETRYGAPTLHRTHGVALALNTGDYLLGEGYRLLGEAALPPAATAALFRAAAEGHRTLARGQGEELARRRRPRSCSAAEALAIYRDKTAPAFTVALLFGAIAGGADDASRACLVRYSHALGTAYQVRDDLADAASPAGPEETLLSRAAPDGDLAGNRAYGQTLLARQRADALAALEGLDSVGLKCLLYRLLERILGEEAT